MIRHGTYVVVLMSLSLHIVTPPCKFSKVHNHSIVNKQEESTNNRHQGILHIAVKLVNAPVNIHKLNDHENHCFNPFLEVDFPRQKLHV